MISGIHAPNRSLSPNTLEIVQAGSFRAVKLLSIPGCQHTLGEARTLRNAGVSELVLRLPDSRQPNGTYPSFGDYAYQCISIINEWDGGVGCTTFQVDNEPNWTWTRRGYGPWNHAFVLRHALPIIRKNVRSHIKLISPPLSFSPALWHHDPPGTPPDKRVNPTDFILDDWLEAYTFTSAGTLPSLLHLFDRVGCNCYFQSARQMDDPSYGANYSVMSQHADGMQTVVCEWASSPAVVVEADRLAQYPAYIRQMQQSGIVEDAFVYLAPESTPDWASFQVSRAVANAMRI